MKLPPFKMRSVQELDVKDLDPYMCELTHYYDFSKVIKNDSNRKVLDTIARWKAYGDSEGWSDCCVNCMGRALDNDIYNFLGRLELEEINV